MSNTTETKKIAPWVWFLNLGLASAFIYFLYFLNSVPETPEKTIGTETNQPPLSSNPDDTSATSDQQFSFYELLPENKVTAPKVEEYKPKKLPDNVNYLLQTGSFRNYSDAERQRANIAFQGLKAEVKQIRLTEQDIWYRVQIGPYKSRSKMNSAIDRLVSINIQPLVKKQILK
jgi:cell division protein FtsN